jgi:hypothetical protein
VACVGDADVTALTKVKGGAIPPFLLIVASPPIGMEDVINAPAKVANRLGDFPLQVAQEMLRGVVRAAATTR